MVPYGRLAVCMGGSAVVDPKRSYVDGEIQDRDAAAQLRWPISSIG